jgi:hypothetical protein
MRAIIHQKSRSRTATAGCPAAEVTLPFKDRDFEAGTSEVTRDDRSVVAASHHRRVVSRISRHEVMPIVFEVDSQ